MLIYETTYTLFLSLFPMWCDKFELHNPVIQRSPNIASIQNNPQEPVIPEVEKESTHSQERELKSLQEKAVPQEFKSQISEKAHDGTKIVNLSEGHNNPNNKFFLVEENESKTENEFVFSENVNIDNLSYNEPILDRLKNKQKTEEESETKVEKE